MKDLIKIFVVSLIFLLSGCSSSTPTHVACDFAEGAIKNAGERHRNKDIIDIYGNPIEKNQQKDSVAGVLKVIVGATSRALNDEEAEDCTDHKAKVRDHY